MAIKKRKRRLQGKKVLASGVFDLLHLGHVRFLEQAKRAGGRNAKLVVIVARDRTVEKRKGSRPVVPENQRLALVESLRIVDKAILGHGNFDMAQVINETKPDIIALGYDSHRSSIERTVRDYIEGTCLDIKVLKMRHFSEDELDSSSKIKQKIVERFRR